MSITFLKYTYIRVLLFLSPFYIVSMTQDDTPFTGVLIKILDIGKLSWYILLVVGLLIVLIDNVLKKFIISKIQFFIIILLLISIWIIISKNILNLFTLHLGIIWTFVLLFFDKNTEKGKVLKMIYFFTAYFILINFLISVSQILNNFYIYTHIELLESYTGIRRSTGIYNTPLATGVGFVFFTFIMLSFPKKKFKYKNLFALLAFFTLLLSMSKTAIFISFSFFSYIFINSILKRLKINLSIGVLSFIFIFIFSYFIYLGFQYGYAINTYSIYHKPYSIWSIIEVILVNPLTLFIGFTEHNINQFIDIFYSYGNFRESSNESWLLGLVIYYGFFYFFLIIVIVYFALKRNTYLEQSYLFSALIAPLISSVASNGGVQFPTGFFYFLLIGVLIFSERRVKIEQKS